MDKNECENMKSKPCSCCGKESEVEVKVNIKANFCKTHSIVDYYKKIISELEIKKLEKGAEK